MPQRKVTKETKETKATKPARRAAARDGQAADKARKAPPDPPPEQAPTQTAPATPVLMSSKAYERELAEPDRKSVV